MTTPLFVYGSLRRGGALERYLPGERRLATLWGWSLFGYGSDPGFVWYPVAVRGGSGVPIVGDLVEIPDWQADDVVRVQEIEEHAGYVLRAVTVHVDGEPVDAWTFAWEDQDNDWLQDRIESGDWLTFCEVGR